MIMNKTVRGKVTVSELESMAPGDTVTFVLNDAKEIFSGRSLAWQQQHSMGCRFSSNADFETMILTITKLHKTDNND